MQRKLVALMSLFSPLNRFTKLKGIIVGSGDQEFTLLGAFDITKALRQHWSKVFAVPHNSFDAASAFEGVAEEGGLPPLPWRDKCHMPQWRCYQRFLSQVQDSGTGPDGEPYSAWKAFGRTGA